MRTAGRFTPTPDIDEGWRDLISSAPPPPPAPPREAKERPAWSVPAAERVHVPEGVHTDRQGCVARVQFDGATAEPGGEPPAFDASDRRMWKIAGTLMGLATLVLLVLGVLTFKPQASMPASAPPSLAQTQTAPPSRAPAKSEPASAAAAVGTARPFIASHALRHSSTKHVRKHKKIAAR